MKLGEDDIKVITGLVHAEIERVVNERITALAQQVTQTWVDLLVGQLRYFGVTLEQKPPEEGTGE